MRYYKIIKDGYLLTIGKGKSGEEITEKEYNKIMAVIHNVPEAREGFGYRLKSNLAWKEYELPTVIEETE